LFRCLHIISHKLQVVTLVIELCIDILSDCVDVDKEIHNVVNRLFALLNHVLHLIHLSTFMHAIFVKKRVLTYLLGITAWIAFEVKVTFRYHLWYLKTYKVKEVKWLICLHLGAAYLFLD
jgi:thiamine kinase-like enzyme